jgi:hypothetical protein
MGCFLVLTVISGSHTARLPGAKSATDSDWLALAASNQNYVAYLMADFHSEQNALEKELVQWTNTPRASKRSGALPRAQTNSFTR